MNFFKSLMLGTMLMAGSAYADGFGFNLGPFDLQFGVGDGRYAGGYIVERNSTQDDPICIAISNQQQLAFSVQSKEVVNTKEIKFVTKRLVVEPYAFGVTNEGKPVLRGNVVSDKLIKEATVKYGDETFEKPKNEGGSAGWFKSSDKKNIDINKIGDLQVLAGTHFDAPKNYEGLKEDNIRVICQLPITAEKH